MALNFTKKCTTLAVAGLLFLTSAVSAQSEKLLNLVKTMPRDQDAYGVLNAFEFASIIKTAENSDELFENIKSGFLEGSPYNSQVNLALGEFFFNKFESGNIGWVAMSMSLPDSPIDGTNSVRSGGVRIGGNFTTQEIQNVLAPFDVVPSSSEEILKIDEQSFIRIYTDGYFGIGDTPESLNSSGDEALSDAAQHLGRIIPQTPIGNFTIGTNSLMSTVPPSAPPFVQNITAVSFTGMWSGEQMMVNTLAEFNDEQAFSDAFAFVNQYWQMAPMFIGAQKQTISQAAGQGDSEAQKALETISILETSVANASLSQVAPNIVLSIPIQVSREELGEMIKDHMLTSLDGFFAARDEARNQEPEPKPEMVIEVE